jgi:hypothetical protein
MRATIMRIACIAAVLILACATIVQANMPAEFDQLPAEPLAAASPEARMQEQQSASLAELSASQSVEGQSPARRRARASSSGDERARTVDAEPLSSPRAC